MKHDRGGPASARIAADAGLATGARGIMESGDLTHGRGKLASWWRENALAIGLIFPAIAVLTVIIILPALNLFWISFNNYSPGIGSDFVGLGHSGDFGNTVYPTNGFIYDRPDNGSMLASARTPVEATPARWREAEAIVRQVR